MKAHPQHDVGDFLHLWLRQLPEHNDLVLDHGIRSSSAANSRIQVNLVK